ncbi:hypothetical protein [Labilibaculum sp.]|uniref:hypothetical protein n=1 Tax=Labilibaculum sp. TaxID=2060723 RepID=UPI00356A5AAD
MHTNQDKFEETEFTGKEGILLDDLLKECLNDDFEIAIPTNFADQVTERMEKRKSIREALLKHAIMSLGLLVIIGFAIGILFYFEIDMADVLLNYALTFKFPIAFVLLTITAIQFADSLLLSRTKELLE